MDRMNLPVEFAGLPAHLAQAFSYAQAAFSFGVSTGTSVGAALSRSLSGIAGPGLQLPPVHGWIRVARAIGPVKVLAFACRPNSHLSMGLPLGDRGIAVGMPRRKSFRKHRGDG
jgi:hypothetical protein